MSKPRGYMPKFQTVEWETPVGLFTALEAEFGKFDLDPCASHGNHKAPYYWTKEDDGLSKDWFGRVFVNPPHNLIPDFVKKTVFEINKPDSKCGLIVMLLPARTDTRWFHNFLYQKPNIQIVFLKGRLQFKYESKRHIAPFPSMLAIFKKT